MNLKIVTMATTLLAVCSLWADTEMVNGLVWKYTVSNGKAIIGGDSEFSSTIPTSTSGAIAIPSMLGGYSVTSIRDNAFWGCKVISKVTIPASVTSIRSSAFRSCGGIDAFIVEDGNPSYKSVSGLLLSKDGKTLVSGVNGNVTIPDGVASIGDFAFHGSESLQSVTIPSSVKSIGRFAFENCKRLTDVTIYRGVTKISDYAFYGCSGISSIAIPNSVTSIGYDAFSGCSGLESITIPNSIRSIPDNLFEDCSGLRNVTIPSSVTSIGWYAFSRCKSLTDIVIPDSVNKIGNDAFAWCTGLTNITLSSNLTSINSFTFHGCSELTSIIIPDSVMSIGDCAFSGCAGLESILIPDKVSSIANTAFRDCSGLYEFIVSSRNPSYKSVSGMLLSKDGKVLVSGVCVNGDVEIPDGVETIMGSAFSGCKALVSIKIPNGVTNVANNVFSGCSGLKIVEMPNSVVHIGDYAFYECGSIGSVEIPNGVMSIGYGAFFSCTGLVHVTMSDSVVNIGDYAFSGCSGVLDFSVSSGNQSYKSVSGLLLSKDGRTLVAGVNGDVTIPDGVTTIKDSAFSGYASLTSIAIPNGVTNIGNSAFSGCVALESVEIPDSVIDVGYCAFSNCGDLTNVVLSAKMSNIGDGLFCYCSSLKSMVIPNGVANIGNESFLGCSDLSCVKMPDSITNIGWSAFSECVGIRNLDIPSGVVNIGYSAFYGCSGLMNVTIPDSVTSIMEGAFSNCSILQKFIVADSNPSYKSVAGLLLSKDGGTLVYGVNGDVTMPNCVTNIEGYAFSGFHGLTNVKMSDNVKTIGDGAFYDCTGLIDLTIPKSVNTIGYSAFSGCSSLTDVTISGSMTSVGQYAFYGCLGLRNATFCEGVFSGLENLPWESIKRVCCPMECMDSWIAVLGQYDIEEIVPLDIMDYEIHEAVVDGLRWSYYIDGDGVVLASGKWSPAVSLDGDCVALKIPDTICERPVVGIGFAAFAWLSEIATVEIPGTVTNVADYAFYSCCGLGHVKFPDSLQSIGRYAFAYSSRLSSVEFGVSSSLARIGDSAFLGCSSMKVNGLILPDSVVEVGADALKFMNSKSLGGIISDTTVLDRGRTYTVTNDLVLANGSTLTIEPGVILKFCPGASLVVSRGATLNAVGTRASPIVFTSIKDDDHGGDTNGDGDLTYPHYNDWKYVVVSGTANMKYVTMMYGGGASNSGESGMLIGQSGGRIALDGCTLAHALYDGIFSRATVTGQNTIINDCDRGINTCGGSGVFKNCIVDSCRWGVMAEGGSGTYYNCIITRFFGSNAWPTGWGVAYWSGSLKTYNCCVWSTLQGASNYRSSPTAVNNISADPHFLNPDNGDFRVAANSPCIDAGDSSVAPETDYYGQPRDGDADIGIYEVVGSHPTGYDLEAVAVNALAARFTIGEPLTISYDVANVGRLAVTDPRHDALYLVSSTSGRQYALGEPLNPGGIGAGVTRTFTSRFALPVVPMGQYRLRLVVNSRRMDVPEGAATENNALVSEGEIEVVAYNIDAANGASGNVAAGASAVCAFTLPSGSGDRLMRVTSSAGGATLSARCGLGFLPVNADAGTALSFSGGAAWISVPAGTEKVWLVLDNGGTAVAPYEVEFIDGSLTLSGISPASIPSSGNVTVEIAGAGFTDACEVSFTGVGTVAPLSVKRVSQGLLAATVDAAAFASGKTYSVAVKKGTETKTLQDALSVAAVPGKPKFWAKLDVPSSMRQGRLVETCFIEYGNSGTADMFSPVLQVSMTGDGTLGYIGGLSGLKTLQFVAAGDAGSAGVLRPGSSHRIRFAIRAGASNKISLHTSEGSTYAPAPWTNAADYLADLSAAATRIDLRGQDATDYVKVFDLAKAVKNGEPTSAICGMVVDENGEGVEGLSITITNGTDVTICSTDGDGGFVSCAFGAGRYGIYVNGFSAKTLSNVEILGDANDASLLLKIYVNSQLVVPVPDGEVIDDIMLRVVRVSDGVSDFAVVKRADGIHCIGLEKGAYSVEVKTTSDNYTALSLISDGENVVSVDLVKAVSGRVLGTLSGGYDPSGDVVVLIGNSGTLSSFVSEDGTFKFDDVPEGYWVFGLIGPSEKNYDVRMVEVVAGETLSIEVSRTETKAKSAMMLKSASSGDVDPYKLWWFQVRSEAWKLYEKAVPLLSRKIPRPPYTAQCLHNLEKYNNDVAQLNVFAMEIVSYLRAYGQTDAMLPIANASKLTLIPDFCKWDASGHGRGRARGGVGAGG